MTDWRIVVMGVSGCGKSSVGLALAEALGARFIDGDDLHPEANKAKMAAGIPLNDEDRWPWLDMVGLRLPPKTRLHLNKIRRLSTEPSLRARH
jgi:carbohydrate kinase (thermoresistant glucokinase family)